MLVIAIWCAALIVAIEPLEDDEVGHDMSDDTCDDDGYCTIWIDDPGSREYILWVLIVLVPVCTGPVLAEIVLTIKYSCNKYRGIVILLSIVMVMCYSADILGTEKYLKYVLQIPTGYI